jgi:arylamine N-acetyltransferase
MSGLNSDGIRQYLRRVGLHDLAVATLPPPTLAVLQGLQAAHVEAVPFENVDVNALHRPISVSADHAIDKILHQRRGGFCFELNVAFGTLLSTLGFEVEWLSARIWRPADGFGPTNTHIALAVRACDAEGCFLVDVGNGNAASIPVSFTDGVLQRRKGDASAYVLRRLPADHVNAEGTLAHGAGLGEAGSASYAATITSSSRSISPSSRGACSSSAAMPAPDDAAVLLSSSVRHGEKWRLFEVVPASLGTASPTPSSSDQRFGAVRAAEFSGDCCLPEHLTAAGASENLLFEVTTTPVPHLSTFDFMCNYHQTHPASPFLRGLVCTHRIPGGGRVTVGSGMWMGAPTDSGLTDATWTVARRAAPHAPRELSPVQGVDALLAVLAAEFGIELPRDLELRLRATYSVSHASGEAAAETASQSAGKARDEAGVQASAVAIARR